MINSFNPWLAEDTTIRLSTYELIWIQEGRGILDLNLTTYELHPHVIYLLAPGQIRRLEMTADAKAVYFRLPVNFCYQLFSEIRFPVVTSRLHHLSSPLQIQLIASAAIDLEQIFGKMYIEYQNPDATHDDLVNSWLNGPLFFKV
jgi:hypothetical protein